MHGDGSSGASAFFSGLARRGFSETEDRPLADCWLWPLSSMSHTSHADDAVHSLGGFPHLVAHPSCPGCSVTRVLRALLLVMLVGLPTLAAVEQEREFNLPAAKVWTAATDVARSSFSLESASKERGVLRFRTGPKFGFRFDVSVRSISPSKTSVVVRVGTTGISAIDRSAWRSGDRYLEKLAARLTSRP